MNWKTLVIEFLLAGSSASRSPAQTEPPRGAPGNWPTSSSFPRIERLRRSRWQWFSLVGFMLVLRLQQQLPLILELMVAIEFTLFMALPKAQEAREPDEAIVGARLLPSLRESEDAPREFSRAPLRLLACPRVARKRRVRLGGAPPGRVERHVAQSGFVDRSDGASGRNGAAGDVVRALPDVHCAELRAFRQSAREPPEPIIIGMLHEGIPADASSDFSVPRGRSRTGSKSWTTEC